MPQSFRFRSGVHLHPPVGDFGPVFERRMADVSRPRLATLEDRGVLPALLILHTARR